MARRGQRVDQWRPEDNTRDAQDIDIVQPSRDRGRSPAPPARRGRESEVKSSASRAAKRSPSPAQRRSLSRDRSREHKRRRRRSRSTSAPRDDDRYRPSRARDSGKDKSSPPRRTSPVADRSRRRTSRSPPRRAATPVRTRRSRSRDREPRRRDRARSKSPRNRSPPRRPSPDSYIPSSRRRSRSPAVPAYRPPNRRERTRSRSRERTTRKNTTPQRKRKISRSPARHTQKPHSRSDTRPEKSSKTSRRSVTPPRQRSSPHKSSRRRERSREASRSPRRKGKYLKERPANGEDDMRGSYHDYGAGRGSSRPPRPHLETAYNHTPPYPPTQISPHAQSPYGRGGWPPPPPPPQAYASHHGSPMHGYPPAVSPYRSTSYPPAPSPGYFPPHPPQAAYYGASPGYQQAYPPAPQHQPNHYGSPDRRHSGDSRAYAAGNPPARRGHYSNLSWTPATGSRGGVQIPTKSRTGSGSKPSPEEEEDPFRPAKELRAEDVSAKEEKERQESASRQGSEAKETQAENKIKFAFKPKAAPNPGMSTADLTQKREPVRRGDYHSERRSNYEGKREYDGDRRQSREYEREADTQKRLVKRVKSRPTLPSELANSDSVYHRGAGNESVVGSGTYGKVYRAIHVYTREKVALKKIRMEGERDGFPVTAIREVKLLQSLKHDNIVRLQEVMVEKNDCYMVFEYLSHDLTGLLNHPTFQLDNAHKKHLAAQLFEGLDYLHRRGVLHRDIKAANILISNNGQLKLADFGLARFFAKRRQLDYTNRVITIWYRSPELLLGETQYGTAVDIWSAACVLVEIFTKHAIFPGDGGEINQLDKIYNVLGTPTRAEWPAIVDMAWFELLRPSERKASTFAEKYEGRVTPQAFDLLKQMFAFDPTRRPSAAQVLEHPYFSEEEPEPRRATELRGIDGDWHEFESKALRKERERADREARRVAAKEAESRAMNAEKKRPADESEASLDNEPLSGHPSEREHKKPRLEEQLPAPHTQDASSSSIVTGDVGPPPPPPPPPAGMENGTMTEAPMSDASGSASMIASAPGSASESLTNGIDLSTSAAVAEDDDDDEPYEPEDIVTPPPPPAINKGDFAARRTSIVEEGGMARPG